MTSLSGRASRRDPGCLRFTGFTKIIDGRVVMERCCVASWSAIETLPGCCATYRLCGERRRGQGSSVATRCELVGVEVPALPVAGRLPLEDDRARLERPKRFRSCGIAARRLRLRGKLLWRRGPKARTSRIRRNGRILNMLVCDGEGADGGKSSEASTRRSGFLPSASSRPGAVDYGSVPVVNSRGLFQAIVQEKGS